MVTSQKISYTYYIVMRDTFKAMAALLLFMCCILTLCPVKALAINTQSISAKATTNTATYIFEHVQQLAKELAKSPYKKQHHELIDHLHHELESEEWATIHHRPQAHIWNNENLPFTIEILPPGFLLQDPIKIFIIEANIPKPLSVTRDMFTAPNIALLKHFPSHFEAGGFRILFPLQQHNAPQPIASFIGATFFRGFGRDAQDGVFARGITLNTAIQEGEEFPSFTHFWIEKPQQDAKTITLYALMDSASMTGAFSFILHPGTSTIMDVHCQLYPRNEEHTVQKVGIAPLASMFFSSKYNGDFHTTQHSNAHSSDGFLYSDAQKNWTWRPLHNPKRLTITNISNNNPSGFGLIQRNIDPKTFQDPTANFDTRASLWVEPKGTWGAGHIELIEIPTRSDRHNNIALFWVPDNLTPLTQESPQTNIAYAYTLYWMPPGANPHILGKVTSTKIILRNEDENTCTFWVDFVSESLKALPANTGLTSVLELPKDVELLSKHLVKNTENGGWRLIFSVLLPEPESIVQTLIPARSPKSIRFKAHLKRGENLPNAITEIWQYDVTL